MPEVEVTGVNTIAFPHMSTWEWHVAVYLFLGGLVAGLMIFSSLFRLTNTRGFQRAIMIADVVGLPLLGIGMLFLWLDLARRWNAWRFFATFQITSAMSWGSWILLFAMIVLFLRLMTHMPDAPQGASNRFKRAFYALWQFVAGIGHGIARWNRLWDVLALVLGAGLGLYTGVLLNTIPARPLWNSSILPFLFLASGMASGCAFLCLFIPHAQVKRLVPISLAIGGVELALILGYVLTLTTGAGAMQRAAALLLSGGPFAAVFWVVVVLIGLLLPVGLEAAELTWKGTPKLVSRMAPVLTLVGGVALRFVVVYAGLQSFL